MEFSRPQYWSGYLFPSPGDLPNPGIKPRSPALRADSLPAEPQRESWNTEEDSLSLLQQIVLTQELNQILLHCWQILYQLSYQGSPLSKVCLSLLFSAFFFTFCLDRLVPIITILVEQKALILKFTIFVLSDCSGATVSFSFLIFFYSILRKLYIQSPKLTYLLKRLKKKKPQNTIRYRFFLRTCQFLNFHMCVYVYIYIYIYHCNITCQGFFLKASKVKS